ncbi:MAG: hypothetical protein DRN66_02475 [Candidatus Nanohalarchaeota archaeon]|nr:MAG: hypothetical protein DRN66_02475 [Candidatus Nanohaloarchaeota archaeon]
MPHIKNIRELNNMLVKLEDKTLSDDDKKKLMGIMNFLERVKENKEQLSDRDINRFCSDVKKMQKEKGIFSRIFSKKKQHDEFRGIKDAVGGGDHGFDYSGLRKSSAKPKRNIFGKAASAFRNTSGKLAGAVGELAGKHHAVDADTGEIKRVVGRGSLKESGSGIGTIYSRKEKVARPIISNMRYAKDDKKREKAEEQFKKSENTPAAEKIPKEFDKRENKQQKPKINQSFSSVYECRDEYKQGFLDIEYRFLNHPTGKQTCLAMSNLRDKTISELYKIAINVEKQKNPDFPSNLPMTLIAFGGYGRQDVCPFSDMDICFLYFKENNKYYRECRNIEKNIIYYLKTINCGMEKYDKYSGTVLEIVKNGERKRMETLGELKNFFGSKETKSFFFGKRVMLSESRYICGDRALWNKFEQVNKNDIPLDADDAAYVMNSLDYSIKKEFDFLIREYDHLEDAKGSILNIVPAWKQLRNDFADKHDIKKGGFGLRTIQYLSWALRGYYGIDKLQVNDILKVAAQKNIITNKEYDVLSQSYDFMLMLRNDLHYSNMSEYDMLEENKLKEKTKFYDKQYYMHLDNLKTRFRDARDILTEIKKRLVENIYHVETTKKPLVQNKGAPIDEKEDKFNRFSPRAKEAIAYANLKDRQLNETESMPELEFNIRQEMERTERQLRRKCIDAINEILKQND